MRGETTGADRTQLPTISVVIPTLDAEVWVGRALAALAAQDYPAAWEVVVADNGCTDGTLAAVEQWRDRLPTLRVVDATRAPGVNVARNDGARSSSMDAIAFCDADDEVAPGWLRAAGEGLLEHDAVCGPLDEVALNPTSIRAWRNLTPEDRLPSGWGWLPFLHGGNCAISRPVLESIGGYDESYRYGADDVEVSWRLQLAGHTIGFHPGMVLRYRHRGSVRGLVRQQLHFGRADVRLYRDFGPHGMPRSSPREVFRGWAKVVVLAPGALLGAERRGRWLRLVARRLGRLLGVVQYRRLYL